MLCKILFLMLALLSVISGEPDTLRLVHILFRHGNRTLLRRSYPNDPHINETFYPYGYAKLTDKGRLKAFHLGVALRERYDTFLGEVYNPKLVESVCTDANRTKISLVCVMAGLYPSANISIHQNDDLKSQLIPYKDSTSVLSSSPSYALLFAQFLNSSTGLEMQSKYYSLFNNLSSYTGSTISTNFQALVIYDSLQMEEDFGLKLPSWTSNFYPDLLQEAGGEHYILQTYTDELRQHSAGALLQNIICNTQANIRGGTKKLYIYSAHDNNVAWLLGALKVLYPHQPPCSACVILELHEINNVFGLKIFYENYSKSEPVPLTIPGCDHFCPLTRFISLLIDSLPRVTNECPFNIT